MPIHESRLLVRHALVLILVSVLASCGSGGGASDDAAATPQAAAAIERRIIPLSIDGTILLEVDGSAYYAAPHISVFSTSERELVYSASVVPRIVGLEPVVGGVLTWLDDGSVWRSPDGRGLGGGGLTERVHAGQPAVRSMFPIDGGVLVQFDDHAAYMSRDGRNLRGGGNTLASYDGALFIEQAIGIGQGILVRFEDGRAFFSPDAKNLGGGGSTETAHAATSTIEELRVTNGGVTTWFADGSAWFSPDGRHLDGGGASVRAAAGRWETIATNSAFGPRDSGAAAVFRGEWWMAGGFFRSAPDISYFDVWHSPDLGRTWALAFGTIEPQAIPRRDNHFDPYSPLVVFGGELIAVGSTVWSTTDGLSWTKRSSSGPATAREDAHAMVVGDRIVYIDPQYGGVYFSSNGVDWSAGVDISSSFRRRCGALISNLPSGRIVIAGGTACDYSESFRDIWVSDDAVSWRQVTDGNGQPLDPPWSHRMWPCSVVDPDGVIWMVGGMRIDDGVKRNFTDIWYSRDGIEWRTLATRDTALPPRHAPACYFEPGDGSGERSLYVVGGKGGDIEFSEYTRVLNDVYRLRVPDTTELFAPGP